ncbi:hypothetical protein [Antrihabitans cavernicola]|nr:hypothetical protein [Spelaeibacter cavernicola]
MGSSDAIFNSAVEFLMNNPNNPIAQFVISPIALLYSLFVKGGTF